MKQEEVVLGTSGCRAVFRMETFSSALVSDLSFVSMTILRFVDMIGVCCAQR